MRSVPGSPDICFKSKKVAVFVDGEFWHGRNWEVARLRIKTRQDFWYAKIERNMVRDKRVNATLIRLGWEVLRFWDSEVLKNLNACADRVEETLRNKELSRLHRVYSYDTRFEESSMDYAAEDDTPLSDYGSLDI